MHSRITSSNHLGKSSVGFMSGQHGSSTEFPRHSKTSPSIALDENLSRLFECMRLEYGTGGFLVSPKWKNFRSQKLQFAEKTRLNNAIWRCWHIQYLKGRRPLFCQFAPPLSEDKGPFQKKPLAVILEGRYWRRKLEAVAREYKKLRIYYKKWSGTTDVSPLKHLSPKAQQIDQELACQLEETTRRLRRISSGSGSGLQCTSPTDASSDTPFEEMLNIMDTSFDQDVALSSLPDTLFTSRSTNLGGAVIPQEFIQQQALMSRPAGGTDAQDVFQVPTLDSLQPNLDEFMEHFESFTIMLAKQEEKRSDHQQQQRVGSAGFQPATTSVAPSRHSGLYENQAGPFGGVPGGQEEVMDHSGAYDSVQMQMFTSAPVDNTPLPPQRMSGGEHVLMDMSSDGPTVVDYAFNYGNTMPTQSFTAQLEQPTLPSPLEEIQAQQLAANGIALSANQFVPNVDPFSPTRPLDSSSQQPRKGRLPRNVSDSQLYTMDLSQIGTSFQTNLLPSLESNIPPQLQAPNLVAHLQSIQPRTRVISTPAGNQAKRARLPRNMSDSRLSSLANTSKSPTSPPPLHPSGMSGAQRQLQPAAAASNMTHQSGRLSGSKGRKSAKLPRNMSDSSLLRLEQQAPLIHALPPSTSGLPPRRRKMSDPQHVINTTALAANLQASSSTASMPSRSPALTFTNPTPSNLYNTSTTSVAPQSQPQFLEQLLQSSLAAPTVSSTLPVNVISSVSSTPQPSDPFQPSHSTLGQLLMQQTTASTGTQQIQPSESNMLRNGTQDPALLKQLYQLQQMLQKQQPGVPTELISALQSLSNNGTKHQPQQQQQQTQTQSGVQSRTVPIQPSLQMKPKNQSTVSQALKSLLQAPPNISIQPSPQTTQKTPVSSVTNQSPYQGLQALSPHVPTVTIQHQPQNRQTGSSVDLSPNVGMPTAVIISPQGGIQATGASVQTTRPEPVSAVPLPEVTNSLPQVVNVGQPGSVGQHILLPASVNLNTLAQLGLSSAALQSMVTVTLPSTCMTSTVSSVMPAVTAGGVRGQPALTISTPALATESQETGGIRPVQSLLTPVKPTRPVTAQQREQYKEHRRISHITAEQKRRGNIKMGFDQLMELVPSLANQRNSKVSKATVLQKTVDYTTKLQRERQAMQEEADMLRKQIQDLNTSISLCQQQLPATGVPVARQRIDQMWSMFNQYVKTRTQDNFKFWIFSVLMRQLFEAFNNSVSTVSVEEFCQTVLTWLEQHCSLPSLRPAVLSSLRDLSKATSILSDPSKVPEQALRASVSNDPTNLAAILSSAGTNDGARSDGPSIGFPV